MAYIKKSRARKELERGAFSVGVSNFREDNGLRFNVTIGEHTVSFNELERDLIISQWAKMEAEHTF